MLLRTVDLVGMASGDLPVGTHMCGKLALEIQENVFKPKAITLQFREGAVTRWLEAGWGGEFDRKQNSKFLYSLFPRKEKNTKDVPESSILN